MNKTLSGADICWEKATKGYNFQGVKYLNLHQYILINIKYLIMDRQQNYCKLIVLERTNNSKPH